MGSLSLKTVYGQSLAPIEKVKELISAECDPMKVADFTKAVEAAKKLDSKNLERRNYWAELSLWSRKRFGQLIKIGREEGTLAVHGDNQHSTKSGGDSEAPPPLTLSDIGLDKKQAQRAIKIAEIPDEAIKEYVATVNMEDVIADDLIDKERQKRFDEEISMAGLMRFVHGTEKAGTHAHVSQNTGIPEWYTPAEYIGSARKVLETIDLDPASSEVAQQTVAAKKYYTVEQNGLTKKWKGRVWLNPPYTSDLVQQFVDKLCEHVIAKDVPEAILLVNNATETRWFQRAAANAAAVCFPSGRIKFLDDEGNPGAPLQGQAILYFGDSCETFVDEFQTFGFCAEICAE